jgi:hypothetical protein
LITLFFNLKHKGYNSNSVSLSTTIPSKSSVSNSSSTGKLSNNGPQAQAQLVSKLITNRIEKFKQIKIQQTNNNSLDKQEKILVNKLQYTKKNDSNRPQVYDKINMKMKSKEHLYSPLCFDNQHKITYRNNILNRIRNNQISKNESINRLKAVPSDSFNLIEKKLSSNKNLKKSKQAAKKLNENKNKKNEISLKTAKLNVSPKKKNTFQSKDDEYTYAISQKSIRNDSNINNNHLNSQTIKTDNDEDDEDDEDDDEDDENRTEFNYDDDSDDIYDDENEEDENDTDHSSSNYDEEDDDYNYEDDEDEYEDPNTNENYNLNEPTSISCLKTCDNYEDEYDGDYQYEEKSLSISTKGNNKSIVNNNSNNNNNNKNNSNTSNNSNNTTANNNTNNKDLENEYDDVDSQNESKKIIDNLSIKKEETDNELSENSQNKKLEAEKVFNKEKEALLLLTTTSAANSSLPIDTDIPISYSTEINTLTTVKQRILSITNVTAVDENLMTKFLETDKTNNSELDEIVQKEINKNEETAIFEKTYFDMNECNEQAQTNNTTRIEDEYETMTATTIKEKIENGLNNSITCTSF